MGIKHLNQFVKRECPGAIKPISFAELAGKVVVVDASIYIYQFLANQALLENMYTMITLFQMHGIVPVFIFDGKPPDKKRNLLNKRQQLKRVAEMHYNKVKGQMELTRCRNPDDDHRLKVLKRRFIRLYDTDLERVKALMQALGVNYIVAPGEADAMCAQMVLKRKAHACMSDDTDMFVYGCPRVLRHLNLIDETFTMYDMSKILNLLGITMTEFRQICVVSGTDYNCPNAVTNTSATNTAMQSHSQAHSHLHLKLTLKLFKQYKKCIQEAAETNDIVATDFYTWLHHNCNAINPHLKFDHAAITSIDEMFNMTHVKLKHANVDVNKIIDHELLRKVMAHENFIFV
jgi:flap endonuclease-1